MNDNVLTIALVVVGGIIYFLPTFIGGKKENVNAIFALNLLAGWTFIGWLAALVWALSKDKPIALAQPNVKPVTDFSAKESAESKAAKLKKLRDGGILTQGEFMEQIGRIE